MAAASYSRTRLFAPRDTVSAPSPPLSAVREKWSGWLLTGLFLVVAVLLFAAIYLTLPAQSHFWALVAIGILSLFFALGSYLMEAMSRDPTAQRSLAWGFFGMGFAVLLLTFGLGPSYAILSTVDALVSLTIVVVVLAISVALIAWRGRAVRAAQNQEVARAAWRQEPAPSALSYATARSPSVPSSAPPAPPAGNPPPPGRP